MRISVPAVPEPMRSPDCIIKCPAQKTEHYKLVIGLEPMTCALRMRCSTN